MREGWRKVILAGAFGAVTVLVPLTSTQAHVLEVLILATMGANATEHIAKNLLKGKGKHEVRTTRISSVSPITDSHQAVPGTKARNDH
jgi:hypothetical protein